MSVEEAIAKLEAVSAALIDVTGQGVTANKDQGIYFNQTQLLAGYRSDGAQLGEYRPFTISKRQDKGRQTAHVDLFYEGDFQNAMDLRVESDRFVIFSNDSKSDMLQDKYGDEIFGLSNENRLKFWNEFVHGWVVRNLASRFNLKIVSR